MNTKYLVITVLSLLIFNINNAVAFNSTSYEIDKVNNQETFIYENNIFTEIKLLDNSNKITNIEITINDISNNNSATYINLSSDVFILITSTKFYQWNVIPYRKVSQKIVFKNYSIDNKTDIYLNILPQAIYLNIDYNIYNYNTTLQSIVTSGLLNILKFESNKFIGLPTSNIIIKSYDKFDLKIIVKNIGNIQNIKNKKDGLSSISKFLYTIISVNGLYESEFLLQIFILLDLLFNFIHFIFLFVFVYPYLIILWIINIVNLKTVHESINIHEFTINYQKNIMSSIKIIGIIFTIIYELILKIISALRTII